VPNMNVQGVVKACSEILTCTCSATQPYTATCTTK